MTLDAWTEFFGWATVVNIAFYLLVLASIMGLRGVMIRTNARLFAVDEDLVTKETFKFVAHYKLLITFFCFVPYIALKLMQ